MPIYFLSSRPWETMSHHQKSQAGPPAVLTFGRQRARVPALREADDNRQDSCWIRWAATPAGRLQNAGDGVPAVLWCLDLPWGTSRDLRTVLKNGPGKMRKEGRKPWTEAAPQTKGSEDLRSGKDLGSKTESPLTTAKPFIGGTPLPKHHHPAVVGGRGGSVPPCFHCVRSGWRKPRYLILRKGAEAYRAMNPQSPWHFHQDLPVSRESWILGKILERISDCWLRTKPVTSNDSPVGGVLTSALMHTF